MGSHSSYIREWDPIDAQLTIVNKFVFLAFRYLTYNNSFANFVKESLKMVQQYRN